MKGERILHGDDQAINRDGFERLIERSSENEHILVGSVSSVKEVEELLKSGVDATMVVLDNKFPHDGDGERACELVREYLPKAVVVSLSTADDVSWGDYHASKSWPPSQLMNFITEIKH